MSDEQASSEETPVEDTPVEETPVEDTPVEETATEETPAEETPIEEAPTKETPTEETPAKEAPTNEAVAEEKEKAPESKPKPRRKKGSKNVTHAVVYIKSTFNNTIVTFADTKGEVISWSSSGQVGFKGSRKSTPSAAQSAAEQACNKAKEHGVTKIDVKVKGPGSGRETAVRTLQNMGLEVLGITDVTPLPHNGCRQPKRRRV